MRAPVPMRMTGPDVILFAVGLLLFSGASYAIFQGDGFSSQTSSLGRFSITFPATSEALEPVPVDTYRTGQAEFVVNQTEVSTVTIALACTPVQSAQQANLAFTIEVTITPPANLTPETNTFNCGGDATYEFPITPMPNASTVEGNTIEEARANYGAPPNATLAVGTWTIAWTGDYSGPGPGGLPVDPTTQIGDPGGEVTMTLDRWTTNFAAIQGR